MYMVAIVMGKTILNALTGANSLVKVDSMPTQGQFIAIWFESGYPFSATISYDESQNHWAYLYNPITDDWDAFDDNHISMSWVDPQFYVLQNDLKIVFLDIDGVLNSIEHLNFRESLAGDERSRSIHATHERVIAQELDKLDEKKVALLQQFAVTSGCKFVITSTWRENSTPAHFEEIFRLAGFPFPAGSVIGLTPLLDHIPKQKRGHEIAAWLEEQKYSGAYAILDDASQKGFLDGQPLIQTDKSVGLMSEDLDRLQNILCEGKKRD